jgi:hypothetical protein
LGGPSFMEELHVFDFIKRNEKQAIAAAKFIQTLKCLHLMHQMADLTNPNYIYRIWRFTKKYGMSHVD